MGGHGGKRDLAATFYKRPHGPTMGWQWCLLTSLECIATGWQVKKAAAKAAAAAARSAYVRRLDAGLAQRGTRVGQDEPRETGKGVAS